MSTASLQNCKKLYELSGWENHRPWVQMKSSGDYIYRTQNLSPDHYTIICPAYDVGYLLRKLPRVELRHIALSSDDPYFWSCTTSMYVEGWIKPLVIKADTPENALCLLAIKLFEEAVL